jgi:hypothetical protein
MTTDNVQHLWYVSATMYNVLGMHAQTMSISLARKCKHKHSCSSTTTSSSPRTEHILYIIIFIIMKVPKLWVHRGAGSIHRFQAKDALKASLMLFRPAIHATDTQDLCYL